MDAAPHDLSRTMEPAWALALAANFGSVERWRDDFVATGRAHAGGTGRLLLVFRPHEGTLLNRWVDDAHPAIAGDVPILALEPTGHAAAELDALVSAVDWADVYARYRAAVEAASEPFGVAGAEVGAALVLDVRRAAVHRQADAQVAGATWSDPAHVGRWAGGLPKDRDVVVYCVYGHEVGRATALRLRAAGVNARFLRGGFEGWKAAGLPLQAKADDDTAAPVVALLYPGDRAMRDRADPAESRFAALFAAFEAAGVRAVPAVYHDDHADEVAAQLRGVDGVLVWCNPIEGGRRRDRLDALLRDAAAVGVFVSTHPDTILRLGTKDVLVDTRDLPFGSDVHRVDSPAQLAAELPARLAAGPRVLKQHRGHSGIGVWRVQWDDASADPPRVRVRHAQRGSEEERLPLAGLIDRLATYFEPEHGGHMIDQAWQPRLVDGMVRAYLVQDRVTGFGHQAVNALYPGRDGEPAPQPGPRLYHGPDLPRFQPLKRLLEDEWIGLLRERLGLAHDQLPMLWDCDFLLGDPAPDGSPRYVLCEINVSSVSPFPPSSIVPLVAAVKSRLTSRRTMPGAA